MLIELFRYVCTPGRRNCFRQSVSYSKSGWTTPEMFRIWWKIKDILLLLLGIQAQLSGPQSVPVPAELHQLIILLKTTTATSASYLHRILIKLPKKLLNLFCKSSKMSWQAHSLYQVSDFAGQCSQSPLTIQLQFYFTFHNAKAKPIVPSHPPTCLPNGFST